MALCPICGRTIGTYTDDPILATPSLSDSTYKGYTRLLAQHIKELQDERHQQEIDNGISPLTEFSLIDTTNLFQNIKQYILELRTSTEAILAAVDMSKHDFLSLDENGNPLATAKDDWTDASLSETKYQCKAIHIEDLRHFISTIWIEKFSQVPLGSLENDPFFYNGQVEPPGNPGIGIEAHPVGDKQTWDLITSLSGYPNHGSGTLPLPDVNGSSSGHLSVDVNSVDSHTHSIDFAMDGSATCSPNYYVVAGITYDYNQYRRTYGQFSLDYLSGHGGAWNILVKSTTEVSMLDTVSLSIPYTSGNNASTSGLEIQVWFNNSRVINYVQGSYVGVSFSIPVADLSDFDRNIYDDYITVYGSIPAGLAIYNIRFEGSFDIYAFSQTIPAHCYFSVTNIKIVK